MRVRNHRLPWSASASWIALLACLFWSGAAVAGFCVDPHNFPEEVTVETRNGQTTLIFARGILDPPILLDLRIEGTQVTVDYALYVCGPIGVPPPVQDVGVGLGHLPPGVYQLLVRSGYSINPVSFPFQAHRTFVVQGGGAAAVPAASARFLGMLCLVLLLAGFIAMRDRT